jgi:Gpi18-like mannosyltransferase
MQKDLVNKKSHLLERRILWFIFLLSIALRLSLYHLESSDYFLFLQPWYRFIRTHGGFAALKYPFSDYNPAYLYLLALVTYIPLLQPVVAIKLISTFFDLLLALFTYLILRLKYKRSYAPIIGAVVISFAPTIFINSAAWGQCDATYIACCLASLYFLLIKQPALACISLGVAISFKLQTIFFLPVLVTLLLTKKLSIKYLIFIPVIYLALLAPAFFEGRDLWSLLTIYARVANDHYPYLTLNAPNLYQWLPTGRLADWKWTGILLASMMTALISFLVLISGKQITREIILKLTLVFALVLPFFLPEMHERYFYLADVVSILYAFYFPRYFYVPVIEQVCSLLSYIPYLLTTKAAVNLAYVACAVLVLIVITLADLVKTLYPNISIAAAKPVAFSNNISSKPPEVTTSPEAPSDTSSVSLSISS